MYRSLVTTRYAKALFLQAEKEGKSDQVLKDIEHIREVFKDFPEVEQVIQNPVIVGSRKHRVVNKLFQDRISPLMLRFLYLLLRNKREFYLENIFRNFRDVYNEQRGIKTVELTTVLPLDKAEKEAINNLIREHFQVRKVHFHEHIDQSILGGFVLQIEDQLLDASVRQQLESIRRTLLDKNYRMQ